MSTHDLHTPEGRAAAFAEFRANPRNQSLVKICQWKANHICNMCAKPEEMTFARFDREIWKSGQRAVESFLNESENRQEGITKFEERLNAEQIEIHGNTIESLGATVYAPKLPERERETCIRKALKILNDTELRPGEKAEQIEKIHGFGRNITSGLMMIFHPNVWALDNKKVQGVLQQLKLPSSTRNEVQASARELKNELGAHDFIELDLFLRHVNQLLATPKSISLDDLIPQPGQPLPPSSRPILYHIPSIMESISFEDFISLPDQLPPNPQIWWAYQRKSYEEEKAQSSIQTKYSVKGELIVSRWGVEYTKCGDIIIHHVGEHIFAVSQVLSEQYDVVSKDPYEYHQVHTAYHELTRPISFYTVAKQIYDLNIEHGPVADDLDIQIPVHGDNFFALNGEGLRVLYNARPDNNWPAYVINLLFPTANAYDALLATLRQKSLFFPSEIVSSYLLALQTKGFVILTGISGTGKTQLALAVAQHFQQQCMCDTYLLIAVRPDWTDNRGLLGYYNPLTRRYESTPFLRFLLDAQAEEERATEEDRVPYPYFLILDEMNLARVEYYFADFLSALESGEPLELHDNLDIEDGTGAETEQMVVPRRLRVPRNLFFTGTVNVDETTYMFSPKVLDRAFTLEFNQIDLATCGQAVDPPSSDADPLALTNLPTYPILPEKITTGAWNRFATLENGTLRQVMIDLNDLLAGEQRQFGYRVANEIARFVTLAAEQANATSDTLWSVLDLAILAKVLPKLYGTQQELEVILVRLFTFALSANAEPREPTVDQILNDWHERHGQIVSVGGDSSDTPARMPRTAAKIWRMLRRLRQQGFTAFVC